MAVEYTGLSRVPVERLAERCRETAQSLKNLMLTDTGQVAVKRLWCSVTYVTSDLLVNVQEDAPMDGYFTSVCIFRGKTV